MAFAEGDYLELTVADATRQWESVLARAPLPPGRRQVPFLPVETLLCLAGMFLVEHSRFGGSTSHLAGEPVQELARLFQRPPSSILAKMANLDGSRSHGARFDLLAGATLRADLGHLSTTYRTVLAGARSLGIGPDRLPDFLGLESGGVLLLLGQDELDTGDVQSVIEQEMVRLASASRADEMLERDTERVLLGAVRVGQHRFARGVLENCGQACVFCGFRLSSEAGPSLLRASHIKPWRDSTHRERLEIGNGLAACPTHDAAFDIGLISVDTELHVHRSQRLERSMTTNDAVSRAFESLHQRLHIPDRAVLPGRTFVEWHRQHVFAA